MDIFGHDSGGLGTLTTNDPSYGQEVEFPDATEVDPYAEAP